MVTGLLGERFWGGVTKPNLIADLVNNYVDSQVSLSDGIFSFNKPNGGNARDDIFAIYSGIPLTPGHTYRLSYMVRGTGYARTYIYAYANKETGGYVDNIHIAKLEDYWQTVTYTFKYNPVENHPLSFAFRVGRNDSDSSACKVEAANFCLVDITQ